MDYLQKRGTLRPLQHSWGSRIGLSASTAVDCPSTNLRISSTTKSSLETRIDGGICSRKRCEGGGDVVGVVTPLVFAVAQAFHGDQVVELSVQLAVQEVEGKEEDREGQVEVEEEKRLKEVRSWMTMEMK